MNNKKIALGVGGTLVVLATTFGRAALASAETPAPSPSPTTAQVGWGGGRGAMAGMRNGAGYGATANAADLAAKLGVSQDAVSAALAKYHAANPMTVRGAGLTAEQQAAEHEKLASFLAGELKVDRATVLQALTTRQETRQADRTAQLETALDQAVKDGRITRAQADAILAAHASGAMRGGMGMGRGMGR